MAKEELAKYIYRIVKIVNYGKVYMYKYWEKEFLWSH